MEGPLTARPSWAGRTFRSFHSRNFRLYYLGTAVSGIGTWLQTVAQAWLVLQLTDSGVALGVTVALQFGPLLLFGAWGGVLADRHDKRRLIILTQAVAGLQAVALGLAVLADLATVHLVWALAFVLGCVNAIDNPTRRSFIAELVPPADMANAMSLNTAVMTSTRAIGPALAGVLIKAVGTGPCFLFNGLSFGAVIVSCLLLDRGSLRPAPPARAGRGQVREGIRYAWASPRLRTALVTTAVIGTLSFNYNVNLPLLADRVFHGDASTFGYLYGTLSLGSLAGALFTAGRTAPTLRYLVAAAGLFGLALSALALAPTLAAAFVLAVAVGAAGSSFVSTSGAICQVGAPPELRGRVMALHAVVFLGSTPIGGPVIGAVSEHFGARAGPLLGGVAALVTAGGVAAVLSRAGAPAGGRLTDPQPQPE